MAIEISKKEDWQLLREQGLTTVIDPMVFRCGELFLKGASGVGDPKNVWSFLTANIHAIGMFFDCLILNQKIPVFNYGDTFDATLNFDNRALTCINQYDEVLYDINVEYNQYHQVKSAALAEITELYEGPNRIAPSMTEEVLSELSAAEYKWNPSIGELEQQLQTQEEKRIAAFYLGGLIFGGYAQQLESEHILQPKRSRLFLAAALHAKSAEYKLEEALFATLKARANTPCEDLPWLPTFFPYLLSKCDTPMAIMREVADLRRTGEVIDYRSWLDEVIHQWKNHGKISVQKKKDVRAVQEAIDRVLGVIPSLPKVEFKATITDAISFNLPGSVDLTPTVQRFWGWCLASLPGNRYRKLLTRAIVSDHEYVALEKRIESVWYEG